MSIRPLSFIVICSCLLAGCKGGSAGNSAANPDVPTQAPTSVLNGEPPAQPTNQPTNGKSYDVVGEWDLRSNIPGAKPPVMNFSKDGQIVTEVTQPGPNKKGTVSIKQVQSYTLAGNALTTKLLSMETSASDPSLKQQVDDSNKRYKEALKKATSQTVQILWKDKDNFAILLPGRPGPNGQPTRGITLVLTRHKS